MFAVRCPRCGAPAPVSLAAPSQLRCASCAYEGPPAPADAARLGQAASLLSRLDARARQLTDAQRRLLGRARRSRLALLAALVAAFVTLSPCVGSALLFALSPRPSYSLALSCGAPLAVLGLTGVALVLLSGWRRRRLENACAATPPAAPGEPARCHVCGAGLTGGLDARVVRCGFCQSDNVTDPAVLARAGRGRARAVEDFAAAVQRESAQLQQAVRGSRVALIAVVLVSPLICAVTAGVSRMAGQRIERPTYDELDYVLVRADAEPIPCFAKVNRRYGTGDAFLIRAESEPERSTAYVAGAGREVPVDAAWLVGRTVRVRPDDAVGVVRRVHGNLLEPSQNVAVVDVGGSERRVVVEALCLPEPPAPTVLRWTTMSPIPRGPLPRDVPHDDPRVPVDAPQERIAARGP